jgi:hypothetical protein
MKNTTSPSETTILRQKAEELLKKRPFKSTLDLSEVEIEILKLIHELEVHHIELEMQNEELLLAKEQAEMAVEKYTELYDYAPMGYFTLSNDGAIKELNFCGARILGKERSSLMNNPFGFFISDDDRPSYNSFLDSLFNSNIEKSCDLILTPKDKNPNLVHISGISAKDKTQYFITVVEIVKAEDTK